MSPTLLAGNVAAAAAAAGCYCCCWPVAAGGTGGKRPSEEDPLTITQTVPKLYPVMHICRVGWSSELPGPKSC